MLGAQLIFQYIKVHVQSFVLYLLFICFDIDCTVQNILQGTCFVFEARDMCFSTRLPTWSAWRCRIWIREFKIHLSPSLSPASPLSESYNFRTPVLEMHVQRDLIRLDEPQRLASAEYSSSTGPRANTKKLYWRSGVPSWSLQTKPKWRSTAGSFCKTAFVWDHWYSVTQVSLKLFFI